MTDHYDIKIDKKKETRTKDISKMISEGGLGADKYYNIVKESTSEDDTDSSKDSDETDKKSRKE